MGGRRCGGKGAGGRRGILNVRDIGTDMGDKGEE